MRNTQIQNALFSAYPKTPLVILRSAATKDLSFIETVLNSSNGAFQKDPSLHFVSFRMTFK